MGRGAQVAERPSARSVKRPSARSAERPLPRFGSPAELRQVLDSVLARLDADDRRGPLLRAAGLRMRFSFPDAGVVLNIAASEEAGRHLRWEFSDDVDWTPRLDLTMESETLNAYMQGRLSLAIAIARGRISCRGDSKVALLYVPATRLMIEPYRELIRTDFPHLALD